MSTTAASGGNRECDNGDVVKIMRREQRANNFWGHKLRNLLSTNYLFTYQVPYTIIILGADPMKNRKKNIIIILCAVIILIPLIIWTAWGNTALTTSTYTITDDEIPSGFDGYRIAQVSDLHNAQFGDGNKELLEILKSAEPDIIAITGDLIDSRRTDIDVAVEFVKEAIKIAPCYYVTGNHEIRVIEYYTLREQLLELGVEILECESKELACKNDTITLLGIDDPGIKTDYSVCGHSTTVDNDLNTLSPDDDKYTILLAHRPEEFEIYAKHNIDLILCGHAHGGQFRLPLIGGLFAPDQGFLPKYDAGKVSEDNTDMIVSRGVGNSIFPFRFNNRPEVVVVELKAEK